MGALALVLESVGYLGAYRLHRDHIAAEHIIKLADLLSIYRASRSIRSAVIVSSAIRPKTQLAVTRSVHEVIVRCEQ